MLTEPIRPELRQKWSKGHEWHFTLDSDKLIMDAEEKGNHFHNDIPLEQIDPYESEEQFFVLRWPGRAMRVATIAAMLCFYTFLVLLWVHEKPQWLWLAVSVVALLAGIGLFVYHVRHYRKLLRFYHRMTGMEVFALFADVPDTATASRFVDALRNEVPPWSYTFAGPSKTESLARELKALHQLHKDAVLTAEEFQFKKHELLREYLGHGRE